MWLSLIKQILEYQINICIPGKNYLYSSICFSPNLYLCRYRVLLAVGLLNLVHSASFKITLIVYVGLFNTYSNKTKFFMNSKRIITYYIYISWQNMFFSKILVALKSIGNVKSYATIFTRKSNVFCSRVTTIYHETFYLCKYFL